MTPGYYRNPAATAKLFDEDGYMDTGDVGVMLGTGELVITGRMKELIVLQNGENVAPAPIEVPAHVIPPKCPQSRGHVGLRYSSGAVYDGGACHSPCCTMRGQVGTVRILIICENNYFPAQGVTEKMQKRDYFLGSCPPQNRVPQNVLALGCFFLPHCLLPPPPPSLFLPLSISVLWAVGGTCSDLNTSPPHSTPPTPCCSRVKGPHTTATVPLRRVCRSVTPAAFHFSWCVNPLLSGLRSVKGAPPPFCVPCTLLHLASLPEKVS